MDDKNNWSNINNELSELINKFQNKSKEINLSEDLKHSFEKLIESTNTIFKNMTEVVENTIKDNEIKDDYRELIGKIFDELENTLKKSKQYLNLKIKSDIFNEEE